MSVYVLPNTKPIAPRAAIPAGTPTGTHHGAQTRIGIPAFSSAGGEWELDWDAARKYAQATLAQIDLSKRDIVLYLPGTGSTEMYQPLDRSLKAAFERAGRHYSLGILQYEASYHLRRSLPTGIAAMRLVMAALAAHTKDHRITLVGISQGAWIGAEILADPALRPLIERAALVARPAASLNRFDRGEDASVIEFAHANDFAVRRTKGNPTVALDATIALFTQGPVRALPKLAKAIAQDPRMLSSLGRVLALLIPVVGRFVANPHDYEKEMPFVAAYLAGTALGSTGAK